VYVSDTWKTSCPVKLEDFKKKYRGVPIVRCCWNRNYPCSVSGGGQANDRGAGDLEKKVSFKCACLQPGRSVRVYWSLGSSRREKNRTGVPSGGHTVPRRARYSRERRRDQIRKGVVETSWNFHSGSDQKRLGLKSSKYPIKEIKGGNEGGRCCTRIGRGEGGMCTGGEVQKGVKCT